MTDEQAPVAPESTDETVTVVEAAQNPQDFIKARNRRNVMIALSLVGFMVLIFSITALRLTQNIAARQDALATEQEALVSDEAPAEE